MNIATRMLGNTDIEVNSIGLGAMPLSLAGHPDAETAESIIEYFVEQGGNFIDTANVYCADMNSIGHNERLIAKTLKKLKAEEDVKVATKGGLRRLNDSWAVDASPMWLRVSCENSLTDLAVRSIFLYQLHAPDPDVPLQESLGELVRMREEGLIQHIGLSNVTKKQIKQALELTEIMSVQNRCNIFQPEDLFKGLAKYCAENKVTFISHSPVGGHFNHKSLMRNKVLKEMAEKYKTSSYSIALSWLLHRGRNVLPIPGASRLESIKDSLIANRLKLEVEDIQLLDKVGV